MKKYTKRQYKKDLAAAIEKLQKAQAKFDRINDFVAAYQEKHNSFPPVLENLWERSFEMKNACQERIDDIEDRYIRRNWTSADYQFQTLVAANID